MASNGLFKRTLILSLAFVIGIGTLLPLFTSTVGASIHDASPGDEAKSTSYYRTLRTCINNEMNTTIQLTGSDNGVASPSKWFTDNYAYGYIYPSGKTDCKDIVPKALSLWGWGTDYSAFLRELGFTYNASDAKWTVANRDNLRDKFDSAVQAKYYGVNFAGDPVQSGAARYLMFLNVFNKACNAKDLGAITSITNTSYKAWLNDSTADQGTQVSKDTANIPGTKDGSYVYFSKVDIADTTGEIKKVPHGYAYQASSDITNTAWNGSGATSNGDVRIYGYQNSAVERNCHEIQKGVSENASAWLAWARAQPVVPPTPEANNGGTTPGDGGGETVSSCTIEGIGWILCPVINFLAAVADQSFNFLSDNFLRTDPNVFSTDDSTYQAWAVMRNIANILFVIAFLFIVFSQLTGVGISNYGVKKMLPRIVVAAILVNLSYFISQLAVDLSNILGYSIRDIFSNITTGTKIAPGGLSGEELNVLAVGDGGFVSLAGAIIGGTLAVTAIYLMLSAFGPILIAAVLALVLILFILVARQAIVILLVVISPLAFVAFLLPNTESLFKQWRKMLTAMLMLFPIIALVFGASTLASTLLGRSFSGVGGTDSNMFGQIIAAAVLVLPLFAVPILLKKSLDGVPMLGQMANKWASRGFSGVSGKVKEGNRNSYIGRGSAIRKQGRQAYTDRKFAENVSKGGVRGLAAMGIGITPKGRYARNTVGRIADEASEKAFENDISAMAISLKNTHINPDTQIDDIALELTDAIKNKDKVKARAAQSILLNSGGAGLDTLHRTLEAASDGVRDSAGNIITAGDPTMRNSDVGVSLRNAINNAGLKSKDNALATWAYSDNSFKSIGTGTALDEDGKPMNVFRGLSSVELAGQRGHVLKDAKSIITPDQAKAVLAENVSKDMDPGKKKLFEEIAAGVYYPGGPSSTPTPTVTPTPGSGGTPAPTVASTSTPAPSGPVKLNFTSEGLVQPDGSVTPMTAPAQTVLTQVDSAGGWDKISHEDVWAAKEHAERTLSSTNDVPTNKLGSDAIDELQRRNIVPGSLNPDQGRKPRQP